SSVGRPGESVRVWPDFLALLWAGMETIRSPGPEGRRLRAGQPPHPLKCPLPRTALRPEGPTTPPALRFPGDQRPPSRRHGPIMYVTNHLILPDRQPAPHDLEKNLESLRSSVAEI